MGQETTKSTTREDRKVGQEAPAWPACATVLAAMITAVATITVALLSSPLIMKLFEPKPTQSPAAIAALSPQPSETIFATEAWTPEIPMTLTVASTPSLLPVISTTESSGLPLGMQVIVTANPAAGDAPLTAKLDARGSYVVAPDGTRFECKRGACRYSWYISLNGQEFDRPKTSDGTLNFTFQKKGTYFISVYICHGAESPTCGNGGTYVIVN